MIVDRGLLAVSFLILAAVLTVWLGVAGPADLRNWQTLIAGFLAIVAAVIAYKAAMAKVNQDRLVSDQDVARRKIGLLLKTDIALEDLLTQARSLQATILFSNPTIHAFNTHGSKFAIDEPPELKDVWDNLDVFPQRALYEFRNLMFGLKHLRRLASEASELGPIEVAAGASLPLQFLVMSKPLEDIWQSSGLIAQEISAEIKRLAPELPEQERLLAIYGEPNVDEDD